MTLEFARRAAELWPLSAPTVSLAAHRENAVYRVESREGTFALRLHRSGYRTASELQSELDFMAMLESKNISVPRPVAARNGNMLVELEGINLSMLTWIPGKPLGQTGVPLAIPDRLGTFKRLGRLIASMHTAADQWQPPKGFSRQAWDVDGLLGDKPQWGRFWANPMLTPKQINMLQATRQKLRRVLLSRQFDQGLIHADMVSENILLDGERVTAIDFDDFGPGFRLQDIATALVKHQKEPDYQELRQALVSGYRTQRPLDEEAIDLFLLMRHVSYLGWIAERMDNDNARARSQRFIDNVMPMVEQFLATAD